MTFMTFCSDLDFIVLQVFANLIAILGFEHDDVCFHGTSVEWEIKKVMKKELLALFLLRLLDLLFELKF